MGMDFEEALQTLENVRRLRGEMRADLRRVQALERRKRLLKSLLRALRGKSPDYVV